MPFTLIDIRRLAFHWSLPLQLNIFRFVLTRVLKILAGDFAGKTDWTLITRASHATQWRHSFFCPQIVDRHRPITALVVSQLLNNKHYIYRKSKQVMYYNQTGNKQNKSLNSFFCNVNILYSLRGKLSSNLTIIPFALVRYEVINNQQARSASWL